ncbi:hypothetical protein NL676_012967 [Syzygium grande]|nr:hypothetical protein NL676_012967 [Syzygium grande]
MGCCVSAHDRRRSAPSSPGHKRAQVKSAECRAPPPSMDEETVKEVLSETPTCPKKPRPTPGGAREAECPAALARHEKGPADLAADDASEEVSEACSLSESVSTATNLTDDGGGAVHVKPRGGNRSPGKTRGPAAKSRSLSGDAGGRGDRGGRSRAPGNSPAGRSDRSPARVNPGGSLRMGQGREPGSFRAAPARGGRADPGERSGRRSRSPAPSRAENRGAAGSAGPAVGRTLSARRTNPSPGRATPGPTEGKNREARGGGGGKRMSSANESLENPLVSLECFIFL